MRIKMTGQIPPGDRKDKGCPLLKVRSQNQVIFLKNQRIIHENKNAKAYIIAKYTLPH